MGENFRKMKMFPLPFIGILPIEIQYKIIVESELNWYNEAVNKIIDAWYLFIKRKVDITNIAIKFKKESIYITEFNFLSHGSYANWYINPYKIEKDLEYIEKIFTGTEDINFWESRLEGIARGIKYVDCKESSWDFLKNEKITSILKKIRNKILLMNNDNRISLIFAPIFMTL